MEVNASLVIPAAELSWRFGPSGGPGGQHANTANTRAELVFEIAESAALSARQRDVLQNEFGPRLRIVVDEARSQTRNRQVAIERLKTRLAAALVPKPQRRPTKPTRGANRRRLEAKKRQSRRKAERRNRFDD